MQIQEAVQHMSTHYLRRVLDSYRDESRKPEEEEARQRLVQDADALADPQNVAARLNLAGQTFNDQTLYSFIAEALLEDDDYLLPLETIMDRVQSKEQAIIEESSTDSEVFRYKDGDSLATYRKVLAVALDDGAISRDEKRLLGKLRRTLGLTLRDHYRIQAQLNAFPKADNQIHSDADIDDAIKDLQRKGVLFWANHHPQGARCLIPEEIAPGLKQAIGMELPRPAFENLLRSQLTKDQLYTVLKENGLPTSGSKEDQVARILTAHLYPSEALDVLTNRELADICRELPGVQVSGSKDQRLRNIIGFYDNLRLLSFDEAVDERVRFYHFYEQLAARDRENLLANGIIGKDREIEGAFEEATRYLFAEKLGLELTAMAGSDHADGGFAHPDGQSVFLWDNKSKEALYDFPQEHYKQFKRYIRDSDQRVTTFLIIVPDYTEEAEAKAPRLKSESGTDTDVCLIRAE
ncbi:MAG TPA: SAP domain-containing protein, partial [Gammaproteobacteria bacterium]|nr:SAP domain-containing protein [Gammaproteobacteria bacterium]